jgi:diketogulonate reductase-like aldo/keto reductase
VLESMPISHQHLSMASLTTKSGHALPPLFYGTAWKKEATVGLVTLALMCGFRAIDTACQPKHYREDLVGEALLHSRLVPRENIFLQTKFTLPAGQDPHSIPYDANAKLEDQVRQSFAKSLENLKTDYLDAVLLHSPARTVESTLVILDVLREFKESGKVRHLGISNIYSLPMLQEICRRQPPSTVQIVQNRFYADTGYDVGIRRFCKGNDIVYQSFWTLSANPHVLSSQTVNNVARRTGASVQGVFYRFCMQEGITVLDGTTSEQHMKEDLEVMGRETFALDEKEMSDIRSILG